MSALDGAALHPALQESVSGRHYFAEAARLRTAAAAALARDLSADAFSPYLTQNTTSGLLAVLWAVARAGHDVRACGPDDQHYPPYVDILPGGRPDAEWQLRTHVSPITGAVDPLTGARTLIVDGAQSLGTPLTPSLLRQADVVVAPLHKHLGLCVGAGLVLVRRGVPALGAVREVLAVAEAGAHSLDVLRRLSVALDAADGRIFNRAEIVVDDDLRAWCASHGLRPLGSGPGVPFVCMTTTDGCAIEQRMSLRGWRHLAASNAARFSRHEPGRVGDPPVNHTEALRAAVHAALRDRPGRPERVVR